MLDLGVQFSKKRVLLIERCEKNIVHILKVPPQIMVRMKIGLLVMMEPVEKL